MSSDASAARRPTAEGKTALTKQDGGGFIFLGKRVHLSYAAVRLKQDPIQAVLRARRGTLGSRVGRVRESAQRSRGFPLDDSQSNEETTMLVQRWVHYPKPGHRDEMRDLIEAERKRFSKPTFACQLPLLGTHRQ